MGFGLDASQSGSYQSFQGLYLAGCLVCSDEWAAFIRDEAKNKLIYIYIFWTPRPKIGHHARTSSYGRCLWGLTLQRSGRQSGM